MELRRARNEMQDDGGQIYSPSSVLVRNRDSDALDSRQPHTISSQSEHCTSTSAIKQDPAGYPCARTHSWRRYGREKSREQDAGAWSSKIYRITTSALSHEYIDQDRDTSARTRRWRGTGHSHARPPDLQTSMDESRDVGAVDAWVRAALHLNPCACPAPPSSTSPSSSPTSCGLGPATNRTWRPVPRGKHQG